MILFQLYHVRVFQALDSSFAFSLKTLKEKLNFLSWNNISNDKNAPVVSVHPQHISGKDKG